MTGIYGRRYRQQYIYIWLDGDKEHMTSIHQGVGTV